MLEKYCDIRYRDYLLDISRVEYTTGKFSYQGKSQDKDNIYFGSPYTDVGRVIHNFIYLVDKELGEREKEEEILFCTIIYKGYELDIWLKEDLSYLAWIDNFDFASWGTWSMEEFIEVIKAFREKVNSGTGKDLIQNITDYKGHRLAVRKKKDSSKYIGTSTLLNGKWRREGYSIDWIVKRHQIAIDRIVEQQKKMVGTTYEDVCEEWGSNCKEITYKNRVMWVTALKRAKDNRVFYIGTFRDLKFNSLSIESIHYDKVVSRFQRFVDEYCTDWREVNSYFGRTYEYKGYPLHFKKEHQVENYFGTCEIHKNSIFKCINNSKVQIVDKFKARIDRMFEEKEKVQKKMLTPKQEKIQELEQLQARISAQLEELKNEKETLEYKGVILEYGKEKGLEKDYMIGRIKNAPEGTKYFYRKVASNMQCDFEEYIDELEESANLYCVLTGKELCTTSK